MCFFISVLFMIVPIVIFFLITSYDNFAMRYLSKSFGFKISLLILVLLTFLLPLFFAEANIFAHLFNDTLSYHDFEALNEGTIINMVLAAVLGFIIRGRYSCISRRKIGILLLIGVITFTCSIFVINRAYNSNKNVLISEVCRRQITEHLDDNNERVTDEITYITIYNPNDYACFYDTLYLLTDEDSLSINKLHNITVPTKGTYTMVYEYGDLDISKSKETPIYLFSDKYEVILDQIMIPVLQDDEAYYMNIDSGSWDIRLTEPEKLPLETVVEKPDFDHLGGFYDNPFYLYISIPKGTTVYYTTDSSDPTEKSIQYDGTPIYIYDKSPEENIYRNISNVIADIKSFENPSNVDKCFVLRAVAIDENGRASEINTQSYFISLNQYKNQDVISIVTDPDNLFNEETGIYVNGREWDEFYNTYYEQIQETIDNNTTGLTLDWNHLGNISEFIPEITDVPSRNYQKEGMDYEVEADLEYLTEGNLYINQNVGIRIQGASARWFYPKRFSVYARKKYSGSSYFNEMLFDDDSKTHSVFLRQGFLNAFCLSLVDDIDLDTVWLKPVTVFLDGEFWYETYMIEKYDEKNIAAKYDLTERNIEISKAVMPDEIVDIENNTDMEVEEKYNELSMIMDMQSYINFYCFNLYVGNEDLNDSKNYVMWRTIVKENDQEGNGLWRWALYDMDLLHGFKKAISGQTELKDDQNWKYAYMVNTFVVSAVSEDPEQDNALIHQPLYSCLRNSEVFCKNFVVSFMDMVNTIFEINRVQNILSQYGKGLDYEDYFFVNRSAYITEYMAEEFDLKGTQESVKIHANVDDGTITLNSIKDISNFYVNDAFEGLYYTDYPIELSVNTDNECHFDHWEVNGVYYSSDSNIILDVTDGGLDIYAVFD